MGKGRIKQKNNLKKAYMKPLQDYCKQLEAENVALKGDPNTLIGQFIGQYRELHSQNSRLSVLAAALIDRLTSEPGAKVTVPKDAMERFKDMRLQIKWELPDGIEKLEDAPEFLFSYEAEKVEQPQVQAEAVQQPEQMAECTDPNCTLPKDLQHTHPAPATEAVEEAAEVAMAVDSRSGLAHIPDVD